MAIKVYLPVSMPVTQPNTRVMTPEWSVTLQQMATQAAGSVTADGDLTLNELVIGNDGSEIKTLGSLGTVATVLHGNASGPPSFSSPEQYLQYRDEKTQNTSGGTFTSGAWRTRVLNTEVADTDNLGSLSSNQITLVAGTYRIHAVAPAYTVGRHQARLQNVTDASTILVGTSMFTSSATSNAVNASLVAGIFTIGASKALELQHQCQTTKNPDGFGVEANFTTEVYAVVELWRVG